MVDRARNSFAPTQRLDFVFASAAAGDLVAPGSSRRDVSEDVRTPPSRRVLSMFGSEHDRMRRCVGGVGGQAQ